MTHRRVSQSARDPPAFSSGNTAVVAPSHDDRALAATSAKTPDAHHNRIHHSRSLSVSPSLSHRGRPRDSSRHRASLDFRYSPHHPVPQIPPHFLASGRPASFISPPQPSARYQQRDESTSEGRTVGTPVHGSSRNREEQSKSYQRSGFSPSTARTDVLPPSHILPAEAPLSIKRSRSLSRAPLASQRRHEIDDPGQDPHDAQPFARPRLTLLSTSHPPLLRAHDRKASSPATLLSPTMARTQEDVFLELAADGRDDAYTPPNRGAKRMPHSKHHSVPNVDALLTSTAEKRPKSSGQASALRGLRVETDEHESPHSESRDLRRQDQEEDAYSIAGKTHSGRAKRYSAIIDRSFMSGAQLQEQSRSPLTARMDQRRLSFGLVPRSQFLPNIRHDSQDESPAESSENKQSLPDSASVDSQTAASTVWDELDDLKSRIKKLELTGKLPVTSGGAVTAEHAERPRTATTAPTTIDSSPKNGKAGWEPPATGESIESTPDTVHPLLHAALAKTKPLISPHLYRVLEATAADALQLAAMNGVGGPNRAHSSALSITGGLSASERQTKRKADSMCRNLTDLCLALCDGKAEPSSVVASPASYVSPIINSSPPLRYARGSFGAEDASSPALARRPMSRLEARRSSILGLPSARSAGFDRKPSAENFSETEPSIAYAARRASSIYHAPRPSSLLRPTRHGLSNDDEDSTVRPSSRAMTNIESFRSRASAPREYVVNASGRSPRLHDSLMSRRVNDADGVRALGRVSSLESNRARYYADSSFGEGHPGDDQVGERNRRFSSFRDGEILSSHSRRSDLSPRAASVSQRRQMPVE